MLFQSDVHQDLLLQRWECWMEDAIMMSVQHDYRHAGALEALALLSCRRRPGAFAPVASARQARLFEARRMGIRC